LINSSLKIKYIAVGNDVHGFFHGMKEENVRNRLSKYAKQVRRNPHLFCYNDCCMDSCPKHKNRCPYDGQYLFAMLKDTPFCPYEDIETYEYE